MDKAKFWLVVGVLGSVLLRVFFVLNGSEVGDIHALKEMGDLAIGGVNPYLALSYNSYPPLAIYIEEFTIFLSHLSNIPFFILIKVWPNLADLVMFGVLYWVLVKKGMAEGKAVFWSLVFFLNPVSIVISSIHGQIDSIPSLLVLLSMLVLTLKWSKNYLILSGLFLGLAVAIKFNPLILLPFFLIYIYQKEGFQRVIWFLLMVFVPLGVLILPFAKDNLVFVLIKLLKYSGSNDFGIPAVIRGIYYLQKGELIILNPLLITVSKVMFLILWVGLIWVYRKSEKLIKASLISYLLFMTFYFGISAQYLSWILPLAVLEMDKKVVGFSISGVVAILTFYLFINPVIILKQFAVVPAFQSPVILVYVLSNVVFWGICLFWLIKLGFKNQVPK